MSFNLISISLIAVALAMDAFSVSLTQILFYGLFFGGFQALMPIFGYFCGNVIANIVKSVAPIVGFVLLLLIGLNMIRESLTGDDEEITDHFSFKEVTLLAVATSIDAFAVGITIALLNDPILIYIQYCRYIFRQKAWKLLRRQIPDSWWSNPYTFRI